jgi:hypothetical protein
MKTRSPLGFIATVGYLLATINNRREEIDHDYGAETVEQLRQALMKTYERSIDMYLDEDKSQMKREKNEPL